MEMTVTRQHIYKGTIRGDVLVQILQIEVKLGTKRHVIKDKKGVPLSVVTTAANTHDMKAATDTLDNVIVKRPLKKQNLCRDKGHDFPQKEREFSKRRYIPHIRHRGEE
jgi:IS5 family transposase